MTQDEQMLEIAQLGVQAEAFKSSALYRYLEQRSLNERDIALSRLIVADPDDIKLNRDLRNDIHVAAGCLAWIEEAVVDGQLMIDQMREMDADE
jgi:hypothetical protein